MAKKRSTPTRSTTSKTKAASDGHEPLLSELRKMIVEARAGVAQAVNSALVLLYWQVGHRIRTEILESKRAAYGEEIVPTLSAQMSPFPSLFLPQLIGKVAVHGYAGMIGDRDPGFSVRNKV